MCRLAAYAGPPIPIERIVVLPKHSLLEQSQHANEAKLAVNGDGFGIAWYGDSDQPGLYRDVLPAWADGNLTSLCRMVKSGLFLAHVRASTVGETSRTNCHPFTHGKWSFMHNGQIAQIESIRRTLETHLPDELYNARCGTTDSELLFLLALANGLDIDPKSAIETTISQVETAQVKLTLPNRLTCVFTNGSSVFGFRYSSDGNSPTLYVSNTLDAGGSAFASEPLDGSRNNWLSVDDRTFVELSAGQFATSTLSSLVQRSH